MPYDLVREALALASAETAGNLNRLVVQSLAEFIARRKALAFGKRIEIENALRLVLGL